MNALQTPSPHTQLLARPHPASLGRGCSGLGLLVFLARPLAVQCSRVKIAEVEGTALTSLLSAPLPWTRRLLVLELQLLLPLSGSIPSLEASAAREECSGLHLGALEVMVAKHSILWIRRLRPR